MLAETSKSTESEIYKHIDNHRFIINSLGIYML